MTPGLVIGVFSALAAVWGFRVMWCEWRGTDGVNPNETPDWWPFDLPAWRAVIRAGPVYNRPSWAVAPKFRDYPGALEEWKKEQERDGQETPL